MTLHRDVLAAAILRATGCDGVTARLEADLILDELAAAGWGLVERSAGSEARSRSADPETSRMAAASVDDLKPRQAGVMHAYYERGPKLTDTELVNVYAGLTERFGPDLFPPQTDQSLRSRRAELVRGGLIRATDERRPTEKGHPAIVWEAVG